MYRLFVLTVNGVPLISKYLIITYKTNLVNKLTQKVLRPTKKSHNCLQNEKTGSYYFSERTVCKKTSLQNCKCELSLQKLNQTDFPNVTYL